MEIRELRIGNLVYNKHNEIHEIGINCFQRFKGVSMDGNHSGFNPILLTEEILLKCGFELNSIPYHAIKGQVVLSLFRGVWTFKHVHVEIKYLHQLQNLYFALTGQELEINL